MSLHMTVGLNRIYPNTLIIEAMLIRVTPWQAGTFSIIVDVMVAFRCSVYHPIFHIFYFYLWRNFGSLLANRIFQALASSSTKRTFPSTLAATADSY